MSRKSYNREYKINSVKYTQTSGLPINAVSKELGMSTSTLRRWISEYEEHGESAFPGHGNALLNSDYEIRKLQKENKDLKMEVEILKKLQAFLKQKNM